MGKTLEEILTGMAAEDSAVVRAAVQAEKDRGVEASRKKGEEVNRLLTEVNKYKDFLRDELEFDLDGDLKQQLEDARKNQGQDGQKATELEKKVTSLTKQVETLTQQKAESDKVANERAEKIRVGKLTDVLRKQIGEKVHAPDYVIKGLIRDGIVKLSDDEETALFVLNGQELPIDKGAPEFLKANPGIVKNDQQGGGGSAGGAHQPSGEKVIKRTDFDKLSASEKSAKMKEGFKLTD